MPTVRRLATIRGISRKKERAWFDEIGFERDLSEIAGDLGAKRLRDNHRPRRGTKVRARDRTLQGHHKSSIHTITIEVPYGSQGAVPDAMRILRA